MIAPKSSPGFGSILHGSACQSAAAIGMVDGSQQSPREARSHVGALGFIIAMEALRQRIAQIQQSCTQ